MKMLINCYFKSGKKKKSRPSVEWMIFFDDSSIFAKVTLKSLIYALIFVSLMRYVECSRRLYVYLMNFFIALVDKVQKKNHGCSAPGLVVT